jgi:hypothetical protein
VSLLAKPRKPSLEPPRIIVPSISACPIGVPAGEARNKAQDAHSPSGPGKLTGEALAQPAAASGTMGEVWVSHLGERRGADWVRNRWQAVPGVSPAASWPLRFNGLGWRPRPRTGRLCLDLR